MPRSLPIATGLRALAAFVLGALFVSLLMVGAGAQGRRSRAQFQPNSPTGQQVRRKSIASIRSSNTSDGSRVSITSDVPLNDYAAYWSGDRYYVVIPDADLITGNVLALQSSLRGQGFQDVRIERKSNDVVISFRLQPGMRARVEQKFNRLDVVFTAPPGVTFNRNQTGDGGRTGTTRIGNGNQQSNTYGTSSTGTSTGTFNNSGGAVASTGRGSGGGGGARGGRSRGGYSGYRNYGYSGGGDRGGGGAPLNIPLPSEMQPEATPSASPLASPQANPEATPTAGQELGQTSPSPQTSASPTPEQVAQNEPPAVAPPATTSTTNTGQGAPATTTTTETGFATAIKENWLPLLIGLLVLLAIGLLLVSRSRASEAEPERIETRKRETIKEKPAATTRTGAALAGGAAGAAAGAAVARERAKTAPAKETAETTAEKGIEPVVPAVEMERVSAEVKNLLEGKDYDNAIIGSQNPETRQIVSTELLAALASRNPERRERAREAFTKHGFFDEATRRLRTAETPAERISAARALGLTQDRTATAHLTAALEDNDPEVRRAAVNALAELRDPSAIGPLNALLEREKNRKVPHSLIRRAIESSAALDVPETPATPAAAAPRAEVRDTTATATDKKDKDDEDREVFEI